MITIHKRIHSSLQRSRSLSFCVMRKPIASPYLQTCWNTSSQTWRTKRQALKSTILLTFPSGEALQAPTCSGPRRHLTTRWGTMAPIAAEATFSALRRASWTDKSALDTFSALENRRWDPTEVTCSAPNEEEEDDKLGRCWWRSLWTCV